MGSICSCYPKHHWKIIKEGTLKTNKKPVYQLEVGEWDDYCSGGSLTVIMIKEVYDKVMSGEYVVVNQPYAEIPITVQDKDGKNIALLGIEYTKRDWVITISSGYYTKDFEDHGRFNNNFYDAIVFKDKTKDEVQQFAEKRLKGIKTWWNVISYEEALDEYNKKTFVISEDKKYRLGNILDIKQAISVVKAGEEVCVEYNNTRTIWRKDTLPECINTDIILNGLFRKVTLE